MRAAGLRPVTIWVPDFDSPEFKERCAQEARLLARADAEDPTIDSFLDAANQELAEYLDQLEK
ncbi:MAG: hypothetical protein BGO80_15120 [Devosia sp. 63-57]|nr:MAG: hypothetical protein ABS74_14745 [Pelagibacterium sp. SCN 63-126]OJX42776.1 MAG: hypothetical protein BGO80_15120 [Devosia sp. 63-57]